MWKIFRASEIVEFAIRIEQNGYAYYEGIEKIVTDEKIKALVTHLKEEEKKHEDYFRSLLDGLTLANPRETYEGEYEEYLKALVDSHIFGASDGAEKALAKVQNEEDAIRMAMGFEKDTILFFLELRNMVSEKDRKVVEKLVQEEKTHLKKLALALKELA